MIISEDPSNCLGREPTQNHLQDMKNKTTSHFEINNQQGAGQYTKLRHKTLLCNMQF